VGCPLSARSETPDASPPTLLVERKQGAGDSTGVSLPDPTGSRSVTTGLRSHRQCCLFVNPAVWLGLVRVLRFLKLGSGAGDEVDASDRAGEQ
jgi:hypothetical protein